MYAHVFVSAAEALLMLAGRLGRQVAEAPALPAAQSSCPAAENGRVGGGQTCGQRPDRLLSSRFSEEMVQQLLDFKS